MKKLILALAVAMLLTTAAIPSFADGNPIPVCTKNGCQMPPNS